MRTFIRAKYNDKLYKPLSSYTITEASNEVKFDNLSLDFTGCGIEDIPYKYQEVELLKAELDREDDSDIIGTTKEGTYIEIDDIKENNIDISTESTTNVTIRSRNIYDNENANIIKRVSTSVLNKTETGFTLQKVSTTTQERTTIYVQAKPNTVYTLSASVENYTLYGMRAVNEISTAIGSAATDKTITTNEFGVIQIVFTTSSSFSGLCTVSDFQIEEGEQAHSYERYLQLTQTFDAGEHKQNILLNNQKATIVESNKTIIVKYDFIYFKDEFLKAANLLYTGYVSDISFSDMKHFENEDREINLELMTPYQLSTLKSIVVNTTDTFENIITRVLQPLINEGYTIAEMEIPNINITVNFILDTVENAMNILSNKYNIWWNISPKKEITIKSIETLKNQEPALELTKENANAENGLISIKPTIEAVDYANVFNLKNVRLFYQSYVYGYGNASNTIYPLLNFDINGFEIKSGNSYDFNYPFTIDEMNLKRATINQLQEEVCSIKIVTKNGITAYVSYNYTTGQYTMSNNIGFSDDETKKTFSLKRDSFYNNLIVGFEYNETTTDHISEIYSDSALRVVTAKYNNSQEIEKLKGKINKTGQIETIINCNQKWFTEFELTDYIASLFNVASNSTNKIELVYDKDPEIKVGNLIRANIPSFLLQDDFIVTELKSYYKNDLERQWNITAKNSNYNENYIDLFRSKEEEESEETTSTILLGEYITEELIETHTIEGVENESRKRIYRN